MAERLTVDQKVVGSTPISLPKTDWESVKITNKKCS